MKTCAIALLLVLVLPVLSFGRLLRSWTYQELQDQAELVVIGTPVGSIDTREAGGLPGLEAAQVIGVETEFKVSAVLKGDKTLKQFVFHHYRLKEPSSGGPNGPSLVSFQPPSSEGARNCYLLFLKREAGGRFGPVTGQLDPAMFDVVKLGGLAR